MSRRQLLLLVALSGYLIALVPVLWARYDVARIPRSVWRYGGIHPRSAWRAALVFGYVCAGWPGLVVAVVWFLSRDRTALHEEWDHLHQRNVDARERRAARPPPTTLGPRAGPADDTVDLTEDEIVLAEPEADPEPATREEAPPPG
jgi:hypothetical protein